MQYKNLASDFFALSPGIKDLAVYPPSAAKFDLIKGDMWL